MMTLDEAIKHEEEVADGHDRIKQIKAVTLEECKRAAEHRQLAEWLRELKRADTLLKATYDLLNKQHGNYYVLNPWAAEIAVEAMEIIEYRVEREVVVGEEIIGATIAVRRLIGRAKDEQID